MANRAEIKRFLPIESLIVEPITKFGGQPNWVEEPEWPISREFNCPMHFVCQIQFPAQLFPDCSGKIAYLFITADEDGMAETWEPLGGENAVIIQPGGENTTNVQPLRNGPALELSKAYIHQHIGKTQAKEFTVELFFGEEPDKEEAQKILEEDSERFWELREALSSNKLGGTAFEWNEGSLPKGDWQLLLQIRESEIPVWINLGGESGVGHILVNQTDSKGIFRWDP